MKPNALEIDIDKMIPLRMPLSNRNPGMTVHVSVKGILHMNSVLLRAVQERNPGMEMDFYHSDDYRVIVLTDHKKSGNPFWFHKDGRIRHREFVSELRERGYMIPTRYIVEWNPGANAWVGMLEEVPKLNDPSDIVRKAISKNDAKNKKNSDV